MDIEDEIRGSDEVEHNIHEQKQVVETRHVLGKRVEHRHNNIESIHMEENKNAVA